MEHCESWIKLTIQTKHYTHVTSLLQWITCLTIFTNSTHWLNSLKMPISKFSFSFNCNYLRMNNEYCYFMFNLLKSKCFNALFPKMQYKISNFDKMTVNIKHKLKYDMLHYELFYLRKLHIAVEHDFCVNIEHKAL